MGNTARAGFGASGMVVGGDWVAVTGTVAVKDGTGVVVDESVRVAIDDLSTLNVKEGTAAVSESNTLMSVDCRKR
jgi:hypothetical protein